MKRTYESIFIKFLLGLLYLGIVAAVIYIIVIAKELAGKERLIFICTSLIGIVASYMISMVAIEFVNNVDYIARVIEEHETVNTDQGDEENHNDKEEQLDEAGSNN